MFISLVAVAVLFAPSHSAPPPDPEIVTSLSPYEMRDLWIAETGDRIVEGRMLGKGIELLFMRNDRVTGRILGEDCAGEGRRIRCATMRLERERTTVTYEATSLIADAVRPDRYVRVYQRRSLVEGGRSTALMWRYVSFQGGVTRAHLRYVMAQWGQALNKYDDAYAQFSELPKIEFSGPPIIGSPPPAVRSANKSDTEPPEPACVCAEGPEIEGVAPEVAPEG